jgi:hypothetical protein
MHMASRRSFIRVFGAAAAIAVLTAGSRDAYATPLPLAIKGYDPVAYFTMGAAVRGLPEIEFEWDEQRYRFMSVEHRDRFKTDPARYAPRFANLCAMALTKGIALEADPHYWLVSDGTLYLFAAEFGPKLFQQDASGNSTKADNNRALLKR